MVEDKIRSLMNAHAPAITGQKVNEEKAYPSFEQIIIT